MPSSHYMAWERHLVECPPGDFLTQRLIAELIQTVEAFMCGFAGKGNKVKPRTLDKIAPWLVTPSMKAERKRKSAGIQASAALAIMRGDDI